MSGRVWTGDGWEIREGRWQDSPPQHCDVLITDPPFSDWVSHHQRRGTGNLKLFSEKPLSFDGLSDEVIRDQTVQWLQLCERWIVAFCAVEQTAIYQSAAGRAYIRCGIWWRTDPIPQWSGDRPAMWGAACAILHRRDLGRLRWNGGGRPARWDYANGSSVSLVEDREHETQKPIRLMSDLVTLFSDPGELIWDPYCGSGTTGVAALRHGRRFLGHELQPRYAELAAERLSAETRGLSLRAARAGQTSIYDRLATAEGTE